ncbi:MAG: ribulose-phosphate 3-epimerase [Sphaerochaeta sp.]|jgi:ribulose-phosphate 3-epimerase|nr:ribulose-phosphate 3-epimerase [Sphaerochaeta sp.]
MTQPHLIIAPSMLASDFSRTREEVSTIADSGAGWVHLDVMDGSFVPNISFGPKFIADLRAHSNLPFDAHLMIEQPERYIDEFARAGCDYITVHSEATIHLHRTLSLITDTGVKSGLSLIPSAPVSSIGEVLEMVDLVLVMSVNPGFGGQSLIPSTLKKIEELAAIRKREGYHYLISVDGGVNLNTVEEVARRGADVVVAGSAFFNAPDRARFVTEMQRLGRR